MAKKTIQDGTADAMCGLVNAYRGNIPVLFTAGP